MKPKILINVEGGLVTSVFSSTEEIDVLVRDVDNLQYDEYDRDPLGIDGKDISCIELAKLGYPFIVY